MKVGFSSNAFIHRSLLYAIKSISEIGYDGIEMVLDVPHAFLPLNRSNIDSIKNIIKKHELEVTNLNSNTVVGWYKNQTKVEKFEPSLSNVNIKLRRWRVDYTKTAIDLAYELNSPSISITSGIDDKNRHVRFQNFQTSLEDIAVYAEKKNILIGIEYEPGLLIGDSNDAFSVINEFNNVGLNFDICHATVLNENIPSIIEKFNKKILHLHISDCKNHIHFHLIPGLGEIDFNKMYESLQKINYDGFLTVELYTYAKNPEKAARDSLNFLKRLQNN